MIVVDASALLEFLLPTPLGTRVEARLLRDEDRASTTQVFVLGVTFTPSAQGKRQQADRVDDIRLAAIVFSHEDGHVLAELTVTSAHERNRWISSVSRCIGRGQTLSVTGQLFLDVTRYRKRSARISDNRVSRSADSKTS